MEGRGKERVVAWSEIQFQYLYGGWVKLWHIFSGTFRPRWIRSGPRFQKCPFYGIPENGTFITQKACTPPGHSMRALRHDKRDILYWSTGTILQSFIIKMCESQHGVGQQRQQSNAGLSTATFTYVQWTEKKCDKSLTSAIARPKTSRQRVTAGGHLNDICKLSSYRPTKNTACLHGNARRG
jgi:hypothetical protein